MLGRPLDPSLPVKTVLVLEDHAPMAEALKEELGARGCHVVVADTVAEAKEAYAGQGWDIVVADFDVPDGNGCEFLDWCSGFDGHAPTLTILFTGLSRDAEVAAMRYPPGISMLKDRLPELIDLVAAQ